MNEWPRPSLGSLVETIVPARDKPQELDGPIPWLRIEDFSGKWIESSSSGQGVTPETVRSMKLRVFPKGAVVCTCSCNMGTTAIVRRPLVTNQTFIGLLPRDGRLDSEFLYWALQGHREELDAQATGAIQQYLSKDDFRQLRMPVPPPREQRAIANFLDAETARIDALIEKKRRMVALSEERVRVAVETLVLGLDQSGPEAHSSFFQRCPSGWQQTLLRHLRCEVQTGPFGSQLHAEEYVEGGWPVVNPANLVGGRITPIATMAVSDEKRSELARHVLKVGDIVFGRRGEMGRAGLVACEQVGWLCGTGSLRLRVTDSRLLPAYLKLALETSALRRYFDLTSVGSTMDNLNSEIVLGMPLLLPPAEDQRRVVTEVSAIEQRHGALVDRLDRQVVLLAEHRQALITAAVNGELAVPAVAA